MATINTLASRILAMDTGFPIVAILWSLLQSFSTKQGSVPCGFTRNFDFGSYELLAMSRIVRPCWG